MRLCFSLLFCGLLGAFAARAADPLVTDMVEKIIKAAQTRYVNGQVPEAIAAMVRAVELDPNFPRSFFVRARFYEESGQYSKAVEDFSRVLKLDPKSILALEQRGICNFFAGNFKDSVSDFDQVIKLDPSKGPYHWQRGISLYYAKDYAAGVRQFESHATVNPNDVENAAWHFLCKARLDGVEKARAAMLPTGEDGRVPMKEIYALFAGKGSVEQVRAAVVAGLPPEPQRKVREFYSHLYLGLYFDATGEMAKARDEIKKAVELAPQADYMGRVAKAHAGTFAKVPSPSPAN